MIGSPAANAGMEPRDIILTVNGVAVKSAQESLTRIAKAKPGNEDQDHGYPRLGALRRAGDGERAAAEPPAS